MDDFPRLGRTICAILSYLSLLTRPLTQHLTLNILNTERCVPVFEIYMNAPPILPSNSIYTSCYCEENVYLLCRQYLEDPSVAKFWEIYVAFISNENKSVSLSIFELSV